MSECEDCLLIIIITKITLVVKNINLCATVRHFYILKSNVIKNVHWCAKQPVYAVLLIVQIQESDSIIFTCTICHQNINWCAKRASLRSIINSNTIRHCYLYS